MVARRGKGGGANCTLSYTKGKVTKAYRLRALTVSHGLVQVATESTGRTERAYYPHRRSQAKFDVTFALLGRPQINAKDSEYTRFNKWMADYMRFLLEQDEFAAVAGFPQMTVSIPSRRFMRKAIPLGPLQFGEHVGSMLWVQPVTFETVYEPLDAAFAYSKFRAGDTDEDKNSRFFYPSNKLLGGSQRPAVYDTVSSAISLLTLEDVQSAVTGDVSRTDTGHVDDSLGGGRRGGT